MLFTIIDKSSFFFICYDYNSSNNNYIKICFLFFNFYIVQEMESISTSDANGVPPALPEKRSKRRKERQPSQYDNVPENEHLSTCSLHTNNGDNPDASKPPPLPLKKRHSKLNHNL